MDQTHRRAVRLGQGPGVDPLSATAEQTISWLVNNRFGGNIVPVSSVVSVTTGGGRVLGGNPRRVAWAIVNRSASDGAINIGQSTTFAQGLLLAANGGAAFSFWDRHGTEPAYEVWGIQNTATGDWRVVEYILSNVAPR